MTAAPPVADGLPATLERVVRSCPLRVFHVAAGRQWAWRDAPGPGPVLLLLPGAAGGADAAFALIDALAGQARPIAVTYPGGASPDALADGLADLLDHLGVARAAVWGSSYGGWWAQAFAARHAARTAALWLANTFVDESDVARLPLFDKAWLADATAQQVQRRWLDAVGAAAPSALRALQLHFIAHTLSAEALQGRLLQVANAAALPAAHGIERTVVSDCADDPVIATATRDRVAARYPQARHVRLAAGGHYPHLTNSQALVAEMQRWLAA